MQRYELKSLNSKKLKHGNIKEIKANSKGEEVNLWRVLTYLNAFLRTTKISVKFFTKKYEDEKYLGKKGIFLRFL